MENHGQFHAEHCRNRTGRPANAHIRQNVQTEDNYQQLNTEIRRTAAKYLIKKHQLDFPRRKSKAKLSRLS